MILTCVILNYNDSETTIKLIEKIKNYNIIDYLVVIDNCSTDESIIYLRDYESDKIKVIKTEKNGGYGYGNNYGIKYSYEKLDADYTIVVNPDVLFEEVILEPLINILKNNKDSAIVSCKGKTLEEKDIFKRSYVRKKTNSLQDVLCSSILCNKLLSARYYKEGYFKNKEYCYVYEIAGCFLIFDTKLMIDCGMYDEDFFLYEEEKVIASKMFKHNLKTILSLKHEYIHYESLSIGKTYKSNVKKKKLLLESKMTFLRKYRNFNNIQLFFVKIFNVFVLIEIFIYSIYLNRKN